MAAVQIKQILTSTDVEQKSLYRSKITISESVMVVCINREW
jgi:hypothetical protein